MDKSIKVRVQYFALLREQRGLADETISTTARTAKDLYRELQEKFKFKAATDILKVAINSEFKDWNTELKPDDVVVFIPPVAGG